MAFYPLAVFRCSTRQSRGDNQCRATPCIPTYYRIWDAARLTREQGEVQGGGGSRVYCRRGGFSGHARARPGDDAEVVNAEEMRRVQPDLARLQTGAACQRVELRHRVLVRILGVNAFARFESETPAKNSDRS